MIKLTGHRPILAISAMAGAFLAMAETQLSLTKIQDASLPVNRIASIGYGANPATMFYSDSTSISCVAATSDYKSAQHPVMEQSGTGYRLLSINAASYQKLSEKMTVWGNASFTTGSYRNVKWTDCIDYEYVAPYVLGDEVGGNLTTQCYKFSGGIATRKGPWTIGAQARYRAEIASRDHDPRIKTVVSDLNLKLGASRFISTKHIIGINGGFSVYNQSCDLDFYNPVNNINTYTLTGMGTYYKRFMGNTNKNSGYSSVGFSLGVQLLTPDKSGLKISAGVDSYRMKQQLRNFNNITLGYTDNLTVSGTASYRMTISSRVTLEPEARMFFFLRKGTENLFGTSSGASYDKIGSTQLYRHNKSAAEITVPVQWHLNSGKYLTVMPHCAISNDEERYANPFRKTDVTHIVPGIAVSASITHRKWLWHVELNGEYRLSNAQKPAWTDLDTSSALGKCQLNNYASLEAERIASDAKISITRQIFAIALKGTLAYSIQHFRDLGNTHIAGIAISVIF